MKRLILIFFSISIANCDWVEIPQAQVVLEKGTKKIDFTSYILTTTSTTTQTPVIVKPTMGYKKAHIKRVTVTVQNNRTATVASVQNVSSFDAPQQTRNKTNLNEAKGKLAKSNFEDITYKKDSNAEEIDDEVFYEDKEEEMPEQINENTEDGFSYANFIPYMSTIQSTLMKNTHSSKKSKLSVLQNLRDHLLSEIQTRMGSLWYPIPPNREAREYKDDSHVDFPSHEGALMTIGFLTFAVFLIKLVLQLIQAMGNKADDGTTTTTIIGRKRRSTQLNEDALKILNYIDQYRFKNSEF